MYAISKRENLVAWIAGGALAGWALAMLCLMLSAFVGMAIVVGFGLDQTLGVPVYLVALAGGVALYAAVVRSGLQRARRNGHVPWVVWPALAIFPLLWGLLAALYTPRGVVEPLISYIAGAGLAIGWLAVRFGSPKGVKVAA